MLDIFADVREFNLYSVVFRLLLAMVFGGVIGLERGRKHRPAGFRTYMLVCIGAALTMILGQYEIWMLQHGWEASEIHATADRFGAQVINGIGFLGAGTVVVTGRQEVKGMTTAAGLWASACMGLAVGVGFYECVILGLFLILVCVRILPAFERFMMEKARNMNIYMELESISSICSVVADVKSLDVQIKNIEIDQEDYHQSSYPKVIMALRLKKRRTHSELLAEISNHESIRMLEEI